MGDTVDGIEWAKSHWPEEDWPVWPDAAPESAYPSMGTRRWNRRRLRLVAIVVVTAMILAAVLPAVISALRRPAPEPPPAVTTLQDFLPRNVFDGVT